MLRIGGWNNGVRASSYEWFEPLLVDGVHYLRTDIDHLEDARGKLSAMSDHQLHGIAWRGFRAARAIFSEPSRVCYSALRLAALPRKPLPLACLGPEMPVRAA
jgi:hypothetical protein